MRTTSPKRKYYMILCFVFTLLSCTGEQDINTPIKIALLYPKTGKKAEEYQDVLQGAKLALETLNAKGGAYDGHPFELSIKDSASSVEGAHNAAQDFIDEKVVAVLGGSSFDIITETSQQFIAKKIPQITCCDTASDTTITQEKEQGYIFHGNSDNRSEGEALAYIANKGIKGPHQNITGNGLNVKQCEESIVIRQNDEMGIHLAEAFTTNYKGSILKEISFEFKFVKPSIPEQQLKERGQIILAPLETLLKGQALAGQKAHNLAANPQICFTLIAEAAEAFIIIREFETFITQIENQIKMGDPEFSFKILYLFNSQLYSNKSFDGLSELSYPVIGTFPAHNSSSSYKLLAKSFKNRFHQAPSLKAIQMYDATLLTGLAIIDAKSTDGTQLRNSLFRVSQKGKMADLVNLNEALKSTRSDLDIDYQGMSSNFNFDQSGRIKGTYDLWTVNVENSTFKVKIADLLTADQQ